MGYALRRMWLPQRVASLLWNQWQVCRGMRGNFAMESMASFAWNQWQLSYGTGGNFRAEYAYRLDPALVTTSVADTEQLRALIREELDEAMAIITATLTAVVTETAK